MAGDMPQRREVGDARTLPNRGRILLAEDDEALRSLLASMLRRSGYVVVECRNGMDLVRCIGDYALAQQPIDYDLAILDIRMPGVSGLEALQAMRWLDGWPPTILITAFGDQAIHQEAEQLGAAAFFDKPFEIERFLDAVHRLAAPSGGSAA